MSQIKLIKPSAEYAERIMEYRAEFPVERMRVTYAPSRIPGMDYLEKYENVLEWLQFCEHMSDKTTWYMAVRESERGKGYAKEQLRLGLQKAKELGIEKVRIVCRDINIGSNITILANGGVYVDTIRGEISRKNVNRYDVPIS